MATPILCLLEVSDKVYYASTVSSEIKVISNNESTKVKMNCPRKSRTIPPQISSPSWCLALPMGTPSTSLAFGWDVPSKKSPTHVGGSSGCPQIKQKFASPGWPHLPQPAQTLFASRLSCRFNSWFISAAKMPVGTAMMA